MTKIGPFIQKGDLLYKVPEGYNKEDYENDNKNKYESLISEDYIIDDEQDQKDVLKSDE